MPSYHFCLSLRLFMFLSLCSHISTVKDTIFSNEVLSGDQTISSKSDIFELGFFKPGKCQKYYIGIWYKQVSEHSALWVANREKPLSDKKNSQLKIDQDGNLVLLNEANEQVWSTDISLLPSNSTNAVLLDTGNLVLTHGSDASAVFWQSFDHPTHALLPRAEFGRNKITGQRQRLVAWRSYEDPAPGLYSLEIDPNGTNQYVLQWNGSMTYWTTGVWNGEAFPTMPEMIPEMSLGLRVNISFVETKGSSYFTYYFFDQSFLTAGILDPSGQFKLCAWLNSSKRWNCFWVQPSDQCKVYSVCGAFGICNSKSEPFCSCLPGFEPRLSEGLDMSDSLSGCVRKAELQCHLNGSDNKEKDSFWMLRNLRLPANSESLTFGSPKECEMSCLSSCLCTAYAYSERCLLWNGDLTNIQQLLNAETQEQDLYIRLAASEMKILQPKKKRIRKFVVGVLFGGGFALFITLLMIWRFWRHRKLMSSSEVGQGSLMVFSNKDLQIITNNFSEKLGRGSFGSVYKGSLRDSTSVAVKKLEGHRQGEKQFRTEVSSIGTIQHINLIHLRGFCSEGTSRALVYDYMSNGSLDTHLFHKNNQSIDWNVRYQIALGIARGLSYLHEKCRDCIIHCDIKPENVLLDDSFCPKVSDFGMAKLIGRNFSRALTSMRGTIGYLAPEWISGVAITTKADVYSYGMMLFEVISGKRNLEQLRDGESTFFPGRAVRKTIEGEVLCLLDSRLEGNANIEELGRACRVACWCIQDDENDRPTMGHVIQILEGVIDVNLPPMPTSVKIFMENAS